MKSDGSSIPLDLCSCDRFGMCQTHFLIVQAIDSAMDEVIAYYKPIKEAAESVLATLRDVPPEAGREGLLVAPGQGRAFEEAGLRLRVALAQYNPEIRRRMEEGGG